MLRGGQAAIATATVALLLFVASSCGGGGSTESSSALPTGSRLDAIAHACRESKSVVSARLEARFKTLAHHAKQAELVTDLEAMASRATSHGGTIPYCPGLIQILALSIEHGKRPPLPANPFTQKRRLEIR
jgi:hypothetical protein